MSRWENNDISHVLWLGNVSIEAIVSNAQESVTGSVVKRLYQRFLISLCKNRKNSLPHTSSVHTQKTFHIIDKSINL